jgi:hypothetical protein
MAKTGCIAGLVGGFALFSSFFWIDVDVGVPFGTFYKVVGMLVGLDGLPAIIFGFFAHMLTAALIGAIFCICSTMHRLLHISGVAKGIIAGGVTGIQVFAIFFVPITLYLMIPMISDQAIGHSLVSSDQMEIAQILMETSDRIMWGALILHVLYGSIMGLFASFMLYEDYSMKKTKKEEKQKWEKTESEHWPST